MLVATYVRCWVDSFSIAQEMFNGVTAWVNLPLCSIYAYAVHLDRKFSL